VLGKFLKKNKEKQVEVPRKDVSVLFVCMGNICRSPTAQGVFTQQVQAAGLEDAIAIDSAGTVPYHVGKAPDSRAQDAANQRGYDLSDLRARLVTRADGENFDYVLVMDETNLLDVRSVLAKSDWGKLHMFLDFLPGPAGREVPDPYSGDKKNFTLVLDLVEEASAGLLKHIREAHTL
jgi:protein-tyrosine phosphatase